MDSPKDDSSAPHVDKEQDIVGRQSPARPDLGGKEVRRPQHVRVLSDETAPSGILATFGCGPQAVSVEDVAYRLVAHVVSQIVDSTSDAVVAPDGILAGQPYDEFFDCGLGQGSPLVLAKAGTIKLSGRPVSGAT